MASETLPAEMVMKNALEFAQLAHSEDIKAFNLLVDGRAELSRADFTLLLQAFWLLAYYRGGCDTLKSLSGKSKNPL